MFDPKNSNDQLRAMEAFFFGYQAFTARPDEILAAQGLSRVHHRILFFIARYPGLSISELLSFLGVSKQALNQPLRQLQELGLVHSDPDQSDKRKRLLGLSEAGKALELSLRQEQLQLLNRAFELAGFEAIEGWLSLNQALASLRKAQPISDED